MAGKRRGLTLLEVMVSITILTIAAVAIIATLTRVMLAQSSSSHHTMARLIAESELQKALLAGPPNPLEPVLSRELALVGQSTTPTMFSVEVNWYELPPVNEAGDPMFLETGEQLGLLYEAQADVWWNSEEKGPGAVERGTQTLRISKMVYIKGKQEGPP